MKKPRRQAYKEPTLQQFRSFCEVCRLGGYAPAARTLRLSSPAVWEQVQGLERHFEARLFERCGNSMRPTADGERLLGLIQPLLAGMDSAKDALQQQGGALPSQITVASGLRMLFDEITRVAKPFQQRYPTIRLRFLFTGNEEMEPFVLEGKTDVAITVEPTLHGSPVRSVVYETAFTADYLLVTPPNHPLMRKRALHPRDIVQYPLVLRERGAYSRRRVDEVLHRYNLDRAMSVVVETNNGALTLACVRAGMGVGITAGSLRSFLCQGLGVRSLRRWFGAARLVFVWKKGAHTPKVCRELAQTIQAGLEELLSTP
jgi:DNA-binding transcriptional LysR family regulator